MFIYIFFLFFGYAVRLSDICVCLSTVPSARELVTNSTSSQNVFPDAIRLVVGARLRHIQGRAIDADGYGMRILELAPVANDRLGARIYGKATHRQHRGRSIHCEHYVAIATDAKDATQIWFLYGGRRLTLAMRRLKASSAKSEREREREDRLGSEYAFDYSLGAHNAHILAVRNAQQVQVLQQGNRMWHLQREEFYKDL